MSTAHEGQDKFILYSCVFFLLIVSLVNLWLIDLKDWSMTAGFIWLLVWLRWRKEANRLSESDNFERLRTANHYRRKTFLVGGLGPVIFCLVIIGYCLKLIVLWSQLYSFDDLSFWYFSAIVLVACLLTAIFPTTVFRRLAWRLYQDRSLPLH